MPCHWSGTSRAFIVLIFFLFLSSPSLATNGLQSCADSGLDWYSDAVGETPCSTYQRLRQLCNPEYSLGALNTSLPPDQCNEQTPDCCCNTIAFSLSMFCLSCQSGIGSQGIGYDAPPGTYEKYLTPGTSFCSSQVNKTLPNAVQEGVCNNNITIIEFIYTLFWSDGSWFYVWSSEHVTEAYNANKTSIYGYCPSELLAAEKPGSATASTPTITASVSSMPTSSQNEKSASPAVIAVAVVAGLLFIGLFVALYFIWKTRRKQQNPAVPTEPFATMQLPASDPTSSNSLTRSFSFRFPHERNPSSSHLAATSYQDGTLSSHSRQDSTLPSYEQAQKRRYHTQVT